MPRKTNPFQELATSIFATFHEPRFKVEESVLVRNRRTGSIRELDILITDKENANNRILVECRDHKRKQDVKWIDELEGKSRRLDLRKVIAVSSSGFYSTAIKEAQERGIETLTIEEAKKREWKNWFFAVEKMGLNIDFEPVVKRVNLVSPSGFKRPSLKGLSPSDIFFVDLNKKKKIALSEYIKGLVKDPKIVTYVREHNEAEAITHYDYRVPCDKGIGYCTPTGKFVPLIEVIFTLDSVQRNYSIPLKHLKVGNKRVHVGDTRILGNKSRIVVEEMKGKLKIMLETRVKKEAL